MGGLSMPWQDGRHPHWGGNLKVVIIDLGRLPVEINQCNDLSFDILQRTPHNIVSLLTGSKLGKVYYMHMQ